jgi:ribosome maturation factor RimP
MESLTKSLWEILEPVVASVGMELVEIEFQREPRGWVLRLYIDQNGGVNLEDCKTISREVGDLLDVKDFIDHPYHLEVSSPGLDRPLRKLEDFKRFAGQKVRITLSKHLGRKRIVKGVLLDPEEGILKVDSDQGVLEIPLEDVSKARLVYSWGNGISQGVGKKCSST